MSIWEGTSLGDAVPPWPALIHLRAGKLLLMGRQCCVRERPRLGITSSVQPTYHGGAGGRKQPRSTGHWEFT